MNKSKLNSYNSSPQIFQQMLPQFRQLGFSTEFIWDAFKNSTGRPNDVLDKLLEMQSQQLPVNEKLKAAKSHGEESQIREAIKISLKQQVIEDTLNPEECLRGQDTPVGLSNLGMTCYFNVIVQSLFQIREVRDLVIRLDLDALDDKKLTPKKQKYKVMLRELQKLFACLHKGKKSFQNPQKLFQAFQSFNENIFKIGEQADFLEFQNNCLELIEEAFKPDEKTQQQVQEDKDLTNSGDYNIIDSKFFKDQKKKIENPITKFFYGSAQECMTINQNDNDIKRYSDQIQGIVNLEVKDGELYKAFENSQKIVIDEYKTDDGESTKAEIDIKIKEAPQILNFYINRLSFDRKTFEPRKLQNQFKFQNNIYIDKFMMGDESATVDQEHSEKIQKLDKGIQKIEKILENWEKFGQQNLKLDHCLDNVIEFMEDQKSSGEDFIEIDDYELSLDEMTGNIGVLGQDLQVFQNALQILKTYKDKVTGRKQKLELKLEELKKERAALYIKEQKYHYELFSILMHDGEANSGHYYCYIYDDKQKCWWKFNDRRVTKADEKELFKEAFGQENSKKNACSLFYRNINKKIKDQSIMLSARLKNEIMQEDKKLLDEIDLLKISKGLEGLKIKMKNVVQNHKKVLQDKNSNYFTQFLDLDRFLLSEQKYKHLGYWNIFSSILDKADKKVVEDQLFNKQNLQVGINKFVQKEANEYGFEGLELTPQSNQDFNMMVMFHTKMLETHAKLKDVFVNSNKIESIGKNLDDLGECLELLENKNIQIIVKTTTYGSKLKDYIEMIYKFMILKACFILDLNLQKNNVTKVVENIEKIVRSGITFYSDYKAFIKQLENNIIFSMTQNEQKLNEQQVITIKHQVEILKNVGKYQKNFQDRKSEYYAFISNFQENFDHQEIGSYLYQNVNRISQELELWSEMEKQIKTTKQAIKQEQRYDKEMLLYFNY